MSDDVVEFRKLHENILKELARVPDEDEQTPQASPEWLATKAVTRGPSDQINSYLTRIERAAALLQQKTNHARELEELVCSLEDRQAELEAGLEQATGRIADLEQTAATERDRANKAEAITAEAAKRMQEMERALIDANARADALTSVIDRAFPELIESSQDQAITAA